MNLTTLVPSVRSGRTRRPYCLAAASLAVATAAFAQTVPPPKPPATPATEEAVQLNAFEVKADSDKSYGALNSNSVTPFSTELNRVPVSADVFTETFMKDVAATSIEDMVTGYSAGAGSALASPGPSASNNQPGDRNANSFLSLRGLTAPTMERDGFLPVNTYIQSGSTGTGYTSPFDIERVDIIYGPQALLYGVGGAGGVINLVSKQARFNVPAGGYAQYSVDQYGHKLGLLDTQIGTDKFAVRFVATDQYAQGSRRIYLGGPMQGVYLQLAAKLGNTTIRVMGERTSYDRIAGSSITMTALSAANDVRNGQKLRYLLATNQINSAANGGASGAGVIGNGKITWDNVDSYASWWNTSEYTQTQIVSATADTEWTKWLSTQVAAGYRTTFDSRVGNTITFGAPNLATNPTGQWGVGETGGMPLSDLVQPVRQKTLRVSALLTNDLFNGRAQSKTIFGGDFVRTDGGVITYAYVKADSSFNPILVTKGTTATNPPTGYSYGSQLWYGVNNGPIAEPFGKPRDPQRLTINGQNYVRVLTNPPQASLITPTNPEGLYTGGASVLGDYRVGKTFNKGLYAANYTSWFDGKLDTLLGIRAGDSFSVQATEAASPSPPSTSSQLDTKSVSFNAGADYAIRDWLRPYITVSDSYDPPAIYVAGPMGDYPVAAKGIGEELGIKVTNNKKTISGSLAVFHSSSKNEESSLTSTLLFDINPSGLNGLYSSPSVWINVDRKTQGVKLDFTAAPTDNWRMKFGAAMTDGTINSTRAFQQLYNDQFYENASGQVTYKDGTPVYVNGATGSGTPVASTAANATILTVGMMGDPKSPYYANPQLVTGAISRSSNVGKVLLTTDATHGPILTGATGLPISKIQINPGFVPPGQIVTNVAGEKSVGYPEYSMVFTNSYTFSQGWLKGVKLGGTASLGWKYRQYYYYPNGLSDPNNATRSLFYWPTQTRFDGLIGYGHKIWGKMYFSTQLNIFNMFNRYHVMILPNFTTGWAGPLDATFDQQPRSYYWTNTVSF